MLKRILIAVAAVTLLVMASTGCNTVRGAGEDVQSVGNAVSNNTPP